MAKMRPQAYEDKEKLVTSGTFLTRKRCILEEPELFYLIVLLSRDSIEASYENCYTSHNLRNIPSSQSQYFRVRFIFFPMLLQNSNLNYLFPKQNKFQDARGVSTYTLQVNLARSSAKQFPEMLLCPDMQYAQFLS